ncbi:hypothetical protein Q9966_004264 [Columba livia]|nr:hypothetical protein Q9966_004264 [Columba livia]
MAIRISWKCLLYGLWNGSTPPHRKTPPERWFVEFVSQLSTAVLPPVSLGTPASHEDHDQQEQNRRCHFQDRHCCATYGCAHTSVVFATCDIGESPQRVHHELQTTGIKITFCDSFQKHHNCNFYEISSTQRNEQMISHWVSYIDLSLLVKSINRKQILLRSCDEGGRLIRKQPHSRPPLKFLSMLNNTSNKPLVTSIIILLGKPRKEVTEEHCKQNKVPEEYIEYHSKLGCLATQQSVDEAAEFSSIQTSILLTPHRAAIESQGSRGSVLPTRPTAILHEAREVNEERKTNASFKNTYQKQEHNICNEFINSRIISEFATSSFTKSLCFDSGHETHPANKL